MKADERIYIKSFDCNCIEDDFEKGELPNEPQNWWTSEHVKIRKERNSFTTVEDALRYVCELHDFTYEKCNFEYVGDDVGEDGRFDCDILVDENNYEALPSKIAKWKKGEKKLWNCHIIVYLGVKMERDFTKNDLLDLKSDF